MSWKVDTPQNGPGVKLHFYPAKTPGDGVLCFHCPGCKHAHPFDQRWSWNGSWDRPTFAPSLLVNPDRDQYRCHSFVEGGKIRFLSDCYHGLAGQTVDIPDWDSELD